MTNGKLILVSATFICGTAVAVYLAEPAWLTVRGAGAIFQESPEAAEPEWTPFIARVGFGYTESADPGWSGSFEAANIRIVEARGWHFRAADQLSLNQFQFDTIHPTTREAELRGIVFRGSAAPGAVISFSTSRGAFSFPIGDLKPGQEQPYLDGNVRVSGMPFVEKLTEDLRDDDYPSIAAVDSETAWAVWQSYSGQMDEIRLSKYDDGWRTFTRLPGTSGDVWRPQVVVDGQKRPWVVWSQQKDGNFDLWARALDEERNVWLDPVRLSSHPNPDFDHHVISDPAGRIWVVWQGFHGDNLDIFLRYFQDGRWSEEIQVSDDPANDWEPQIASDGKGKAFIVWDSYRAGNYDVYLRRWEDGRLGEVEAVTEDPRFQAHASVAVDGEGRVWVAWAETGANWGKDTGLTDNPQWREHPQETWNQWWTESGKSERLYDHRKLNLVVFDGGQKRRPLEELGDALEQAGIPDHDFPRLLVDSASGRVGLLFHRWTLLGEWALEPMRKPVAIWEQALIFYQGDRWSPIVTLPESRGRISMRSDAAFAPDGSLWVIWPTDGRLLASPYEPRAGNVYAARLPAEDPGPGVKLADWSPTAPPLPPPVHPNENVDVAAVRAYRSYVHGVEKRIVRGDFHRHTEFSWDNGGLRDGSLFDFYRYVLDAAALDFGAVTDHNAGGDHEYWWWLTEKSCDLFHVPRAFTTFYAYERSVQYPGGHRNVFHTRRGVPVVSFFTEPAFQRPRPGIAAFPATLVENDTQLLYQSLHQSGGISIPHTTGSGGGTNWQDNDPEVEPVVEIYQGARVSYEYPGAPRAARTPEDFRDFREDGFVWNAYRKGYRIGTIASSDHFSTHISYAMVYTDQPSREAVFEAVKKRHTYGATDNIILDFRMGEHFMGEEFRGSELPPLKIRAIGTGRIARIDIIRNEEVIYSAAPENVGRDVSLIYVDQAAAPGASYYYVRVIQEDSEMAWSSPIWIDWQP